jgi:hypothetical protein
MDPATTTSSCSEDAMRTNRSLLLLGALLVLGPAARQPASASASPPPSDICWRTANAALQAAQEELRAECSLALAKSAHMTNTHAREEFLAAAFEGLHHGLEGAEAQFARRIELCGRRGRREARDRHAGAPARRQVLPQRVPARDGRGHLDRARVRADGRHAVRHVRRLPPDGRPVAARPARGRVQEQSRSG